MVWAWLVAQEQITIKECQVVRQKAHDQEVMGSNLPYEETIFHGLNHWGNFSSRLSKENYSVYKSHFV